ncbi:MAG: hypothetical protein QXX68_01215 [Candidatus Pacearchaeota archaeon]
MIVVYLKNLLEKIKRFFRREYLVVSPEKFKELSNGCFERGIFRFFRPVYVENGVDLHLADREGLRNYKRGLENSISAQPKTNNKNSQSYERRKSLDDYLASYIEKLSHYGEEYKERMERFVAGLKRGFDWLLENTTPIKDWREIEFSFCPSYSGFEIKRTSAGYKFRYG